MWLQKQQLKTGLGECSVVDMALCAISLDIRSEATEQHSAVLTVSTGPPVATHHNRGAHSISRDRGHLGVMSTKATRPHQVISADSKASEGPTPHLCLNVYCLVSHQTWLLPPSLWPHFYSFWAIIDSQKKTRGGEGKRCLLGLKGKYILYPSPSYASKFWSAYSAERDRPCATTTGCLSLGRKTKLIFLPRQRQSRNTKDTAHPVSLGI